MSTSLTTTSSPFLLRLAEAVTAGEEEQAEIIAREVLARGLDTTEAAVEGLTRGIDEVGRRFAEKEYYLTDVILALDAFKAGLRVLQPHLPQSILADDGNAHDFSTNLLHIVQAKVQAMLCGDPETANAACQCNTCVKIYEQMSAFVSK